MLPDALAALSASLAQPNSALRTSNCLITVDHFARALTALAGVGGHKGSDLVLSLPRITPDAQPELETFAMLEQLEAALASTEFCGGGGLLGPAPGRRRRAAHQLGEQFHDNNCPDAPTRPRLHAHAQLQRPQGQNQARYGRGRADTGPNGHGQRDCVKARRVARGAHAKGPTCFPLQRLLVRAHPRLVNESCRG